MDVQDELDVYEETKHEVEEVVIEERLREGLG